MTTAKLSFFDKFLQSPYVPTARSLLIASLFMTIVMSLLMIASASIPFAQSHDMPSLRFFWMQLLYVSVGLAMGWVVYQVPLRWFSNFSLMVAGWVFLVLLLVLTLLVGTKINGSTRWLDFGPVNLQVAEFAKLMMVFVAADYVVRRSAEVRESIWSGWRLLIWYTPVLLLVFWQPDFGSVVVIFLTAVVILFVSGVPLRHYLFLGLAGLPMLVVGMIMADYRQARLLSFLDPFDDLQKTDYQLARSLVAFGRGEVNGMGYGDSVLKLSHLPEAHTDFILAITGEELGFLGVGFVLALQAVMIGSVMKISHTCLKRRQLRLSYATFGFATILFGQLLINAGMNMGIMPTKGLTLPFYSFGGSSMLMFMMMIAIVLKVDKESPFIYRNNLNREY